MAVLKEYYWAVMLAAPKVVRSARHLAERSAGSTADQTVTMRAARLVELLAASTAAQWDPQ
jgi:hypothetical protein